MRGFGFGFGIWESGFDWWGLRGGGKWEEEWRGSEGVRV